MTMLNIKKDRCITPVLLLNFRFYEMVKREIQQNADTDSGKVNFSKHILKKIQNCQIWALKQERFE